jgi:hypothetical protein
VDVYTRRYSENGCPQIRRWLSLMFRDWTMLCIIYHYHSVQQDGICGGELRFREMSDKAAVPLSSGSILDNRPNVDNEMICLPV